MHHSLWMVSFADEAGEFCWRIKHYHQISPVPSVVPVLSRTFPPFLARPIHERRPDSFELSSVRFAERYARVDTFLSWSASHEDVFTATRWTPVIVRAGLPRNFTTKSYGLYAGRGLPSIESTTMDFV